MTNIIRYILWLPFIVIAILSLTTFLIFMYIGFMVTHGFDEASKELDFYLDNLSR
jgi:hypothetical protein